MEHGHTFTATIARGAFMALAVCSAAISLLFLIAVPVAFAGSQDGVSIKVFTSEDDQFWANSVMIEGVHEVMLVDAQLTKTNADRVLQAIRETHKPLSLIYITHEHADHFLGLEVFRGAYPSVRIIATSAVLARINQVYQERIDKWKQLLGPRGTLFTVQKALPLMNDGGSIILNGSVASVKGTAAFGVYAASKAALRSFVRTWTTDLKDRRIRSNVVSPGPINTPLASRQSTDVIARMVSTIPMGRMGEPEEVAKVALFHASDDSSFVTGIELFVDGGRAQV
jgi:NAD(P)-dependent dehydrogenase (short-subunit alcohol dehydrogenase family)